MRTAFREQRPPSHDRSSVLLRLTLGLVMSLTCASLGGCLLHDDEAGKNAGADHPGGRLAAVKEISVEDAHQAVLVQRRSLPLTVQVAKPGDLRLSVQVSHGDEQASSTRPLTLHRKGRVPIEFKLSEQMTTLMSICGTIGLTVSAGGHRAVRNIVPGPPTCGRFFGAEAPFNQKLAADAPLDKDDRGVTYALLSQVRDGYLRTQYPTIVTTDYAVPIYSVPGGLKRAPVVVDVPSWGHAIRQEFREGVPVPEDARPAAGTDAHMVIQQPSSGAMWEMWKASRRKNTWHAKFGGRSLSTERFRGYFGVAGVKGEGATATGLALVSGLITIGELRRGHIDHALAFSIPRTRSGWWTSPAQRTDGWVPDATGVPEGARFRLDPKLDLAALKLPRALEVIAKAAQEYGMVVRDTAGSVAFVAEDPTPYAGPSPYGKLFGESPLTLLRKFPWNRLQLTRMSLRTYAGDGAAGKVAPRWPAPSGPPPVCEVPGMACP